MMVKDGDGALIDFEWPSFWYFVKSGFAATVGVAAAVVVLWIPMVFLYLTFVGWFLKLVVQALQRF